MPGPVLVWTNVSDPFGHLPSKIAGSYENSVSLFEELGVFSLNGGKVPGNPGRVGHTL